MHISTIYIGADHRGFNLKEQLKSWLIDLDYQVTDLGNSEYDQTDDYPDFAIVVGEAVIKAEVSQESPVQENFVQANSVTRGIIICGSGVGANIAANKVRGVRASLVESVSAATHGRSDDDLNVITLSADFIDLSQAQQIVRAFLNTPYKNEERHARRLQKITAYEERTR